MAEQTSAGALGQAWFPADPNAVWDPNTATAPDATAGNFVQPPPPRGALAGRTPAPAPARGAGPLAQRGTASDIPPGTPPGQIEGSPLAATLGGNQADAQRSGAMDMGMMNLQYQKYIDDQHAAQAARTQQVMNILQASKTGNMPMLAAAGAMLAPTRTGGFAESLGKGFEAAVPVEETERKQQEEMASRILASESQADWRNAMTTERMGANINTVQGRQNVANTAAAAKLGAAQLTHDAWIERATIAAGRAPDLVKNFQFLTQPRVNADGTPADPLMSEQDALRIFPPTKAADRTPVAFTNAVDNYAAKLADPFVGKALRDTSNDPATGKPWEPRAQAERDVRRLWGTPPTAGGGPPAAAAPAVQPPPEAADYLRAHLWENGRYNADLAAKWRQKYGTDPDAVAPRPR